MILKNCLYAVNDLIRKRYYVLLLILEGIIITFLGLFTLNGLKKIYETKTALSKLDNQDIVYFENTGSNEINTAESIKTVKSVLECTDSYYVFYSPTIEPVIVCSESSAVIESYFKVSYDLPFILTNNDFYKTGQLLKIGETRKQQFKIRGTIPDNLTIFYHDRIADLNGHYLVFMDYELFSACFYNSSDLNGLHIFVNDKLTSFSLLENETIAKNYKLVSLNSPISENGILRSILTGNLFLFLIAIGFVFMTIHYVLFILGLFEMNLPEYVIHLNCGCMLSHIFMRFLIALCLITYIPPMLIFSVLEKTGIMPLKTLFSCLLISTLSNTAAALLEIRTIDFCAIDELLR